MADNYLYMSGNPSSLSAHGEIKKLWDIKVVNEGSVLELRAIKGSEIVSTLFKSSRYKSIDELKTAFENEAKGRPGDRRGYPRQPAARRL